MKWNEFFSSVNQSGSYLKKTKIQISLLLPERCWYIYLTSLNLLSWINHFYETSGDEVKTRTGALGESWVSYSMC